MTVANDIPTPSANPSLIGQEAAEATLLESFRSGRLPHGWLLCGPRGVGKATLAYRFARHLLAGGEAAPGLFGSSGADMVMSEENPVFRHVVAGTHPALAVLERRENEKGNLRQVIQVEDVRQVVSFLRHTSASGGWRVVIVDAADDMNRSAANAFLKILEEPPAQVVMLLVTQNEGGLMATLRSRCCRLHLSPLPDASVREMMISWFPELEDEARELLVRLAEGSPGRALALARSGGAKLYQSMIALLAALPNPPGDQLLSFADSLSQGRDGTAFRTGMELLRWWVATMVRQSEGGNDAVEFPSAAERSLMERLSGWRPAPFWLAFWERLGHHARSAERANLDRRQVVLSAFLELETLEAGR